MFVGRRSCEERRDMGRALACFPPRDISDGCIKAGDNNNLHRNQHRDPSWPQSRRIRELMCSAQAGRTGQVAEERQLEGVALTSTRHCLRSCTPATGGSTDEQEVLQKQTH